MGTDAVLVVFGLVGIYLYGFFSIISIFDTSGPISKSEKLFLIIHFVSIIESTMQAVFITNALKMYSQDRLIRKKKPARSMITLLIFVDISIWLLETFSVKKYDMMDTQLAYYDIVFWSIATSISTPLAIFFRFHASVCLSDIWKILYEPIGSS